jgi:hypothetical protein
VSQAAVHRWLLLLPQLPPQPSSLRVRVWRRLQQLGAVAVRNAAYALPETEETLEDLTWLQQEILDAGGGAPLLRASGIGTADAEIEALFREDRSRGYRKLAEEAATLLRALRTEKGWEPDDLSGAARTLRQIAARLEAVRALDFFQAPGLDEAEAAVRASRELLDVRTGRVVPREEETGAMPETDRGRLWVTRAGVYVDRLACAWMILRFVDPEARFAFVAPGEALPDGAIPFDMAGAELGHHESRCSAETLCWRYRPDDVALQAVAEVVHDLDLKDEGFGRPEAPGLKRLLDGLCAGTSDDPERIRKALPLFDALYAGFQQ